MNVPTYLVAQNIHAPCFTTPNIFVKCFVFSNFASEILSLKFCHSISTVQLLQFCYMFRHRLSLLRNTNINIRDKRFVQVKVYKEWKDMWTVWSKNISLLYKSKLNCYDLIWHPRELWCGRETKWNKIKMLPKK